MKNNLNSLTSFALVSAGLFLTGCSEKQKTDTENVLADAKSTAQDSWTDVKVATKKTWADLADATYDERQSFKAGIAAMDDKFSEKLDSLGDHSADTADSTRDGWNDGVAKLKQARSDLTAELDKLGNATAESWDVAKARVAAAWQKVEAAYHELAVKIQS